MTFSLAGRCSRTGMLGTAVATSSICVGARCPHARAGTGAVLSQFRTDPRLGTRGLELLRSGMSAPDARDALVSGDPAIAWRQLAIVDRTGGTAVFTGEKVAELHAAAEGRQCAAAGNLLSGTGVAAAMVAGFEAHPADHLADRLLHALEAGEAAGGERRQVKSAALLVVADHAFPLVDLRVDLDPSPLARLRFLWELYEPQMDRMVTQAVDPASLD